MCEHLVALRRYIEDIRRVEKHLQACTEQDAVFAKLLTFHGVGLVTAVTMRAEIGHFDRFSNGKQLSRFCGVTPRNASSGNRQADAGLIKAGNPHLRRVLIELAHRLINTRSPSLVHFGWKTTSHRKKEKCCCGGCRKPLGAMGASSNATVTVGRITT